jgi:hypothetical protein
MSREESNTTKITKWSQWLMPVILPTQEAKIRRIMV